MQSLAIIGTGIAGMAAGHLLKHKYNITFFEKNDYVGGHTNTITVDEDGSNVNIDTGFMVFNHVTYPNLTKLFTELNVETMKTDMSFSVQHIESGLEYCGSGLSGLFAQRKNLLSVKHIKMLAQIARFNKESLAVLNTNKYDDYSLGQYIKENGYSDDMLWKYLVPMSSAVWSTPMDLMLKFPAKTLIRFFYNHGFLGLNTQHQWYTVVNGSKSYRDKIMQGFTNVHINNGAVKIKRDNGKASVITNDSKEYHFDKVILACHADEALALLDEPSTLENELMKNFKYQENIATLHTDESIMPKLKRVWSAWNYRIDSINETFMPSTVYWMNKLQKVSKKKNYFVSINNPGLIAKNKIIKTINYTHPLFDVPAINAQKELHQLNQSGPIYFCGSYFNYGFHEDALTSAINLSKIL